MWAFSRRRGKHPRDVFEEMTRELAARAIELKETTAWTPAQLVSRPNKEFTRYDSLFVDRQNPDGDIIFARRTTLAVPATLIRLSPDGSEEEWIRLPSGGRVSMAHLENGGENRGYRLVWNALRHHPVFEAASVSDFTVVDLDARGRVVRRFHPVTGSRLLYPGLSPDGRYIAAVDMGRGGKNRLVVLETESGEIVRNSLWSNRVPPTLRVPLWR